jgi:hypothetical protein
MGAQHNGGDLMQNHIFKSIIFKWVNFFSAMVHRTSSDVVYMAD